MKKAFCVSLVCLLTASVSYADWVVVMKTSSEGKDTEQIIRAKDNMMRLDLGTRMSTIVDVKSKGHIMLIHEQKMIMKVDSFFMKSGAAAMGQMIVGANDKDSKFTPTGEMEKIGDWECEIVNWENGVFTGTFWVAKDFPSYQEIGAVLDGLSEAGGNPAMSRMPKSKEFKGMVIKSITTLQKLGHTTTSILVSAKKEDIEASVFALPAGYTEMKVPGIPGLK